MKEKISKYLIKAQKAKKKKKKKKTVEQVMQSDRKRVVQQSGICSNLHSLLQSLHMRIFLNRRLYINEGAGIHYNTCKNSYFNGDALPVQLNAVY